jgi:hypothetical protein
LLEAAPFQDPLSEDLMNIGKLRIVSYLAGLAGVLVTSSAFAQAADAAPAAAAPAPPPQPVAADASASSSGSAQVGMALPGAAPQAAAVAGSSDHDAVVGRLAVGYLGRNGVTIGGGAVIQAPVVGVRYWLSDMLGIDAGLGFGFGGSSTEVGGMDNDGPSAHAFIIHGGVPLSLASAGHFSFQVVPELNVGFAGTSQDVGGMTNKNSGFHMDLGARAGAEIHFGFINVPQLSLQGSIGARLNIDSQKVTTMGTDASSSSWSLGTTVGDNPWNIFTSNVAALYYF